MDLHVPDEEDVEIKEYIGMIHDMKKALKKPSYKSNVIKLS